MLGVGRAEAVLSESYRDLIAWQRAMALVTSVYACTEGFPSRETFGLANQLRRAAVSVPSNIAEGKGRRSRREYVHFLYLARGSLFETETQLEIARNLGYLADDEIAGLRDQLSGVARVLNGLIQAIQRRVPDPD